MSWLRARMCSGSSCRYSIARVACSVPSMPRQRRPGHKPCLPSMKRRAVSMVMVSMMTSWRAGPPDRSERLRNPVPCSLLSSGQRSVDPEAGCESWSHVPWRDLSLLLNCNLRPAPDHRKRDGIRPCARQVSCSVSSCLPWFHAGSTSTCPPHTAGPAVCGGILFQPGKTGRRTKRPFPPDPINGMSVHHHLAYETVGYAPDYVTLGSLVNSVKGGSYTPR